MDIQQTVFNCKHIIFFTFFLITLSVVLTFSKSAEAYDSSLFVVEDIKVDVTADDAVSAQEQAFGEAQLQAFDVLADRLVSETDVTSMAKPDASMIASMIKDYEVSNEQVSSVRYVGDFTFCFDPKSLSNYFSITGVQYTDTKSKPLLVLPILQINGKNTIWSEENIWLRSWASTTFSTALVPVEVPIGDLDDVADINDDNALRFERKNLDRMLMRYNAKEAAIVIALPDKVLAEKKLEQEASGQLQISIYRTDRGSAEYVNDFRLKAGAKETVEKFYERAMLRGFQALQKNWKKRTAASAAQSQLYYVRMPVSELSKLVEAQDILRTLPGLSTVSVVSVRPVEARLLLTFRGDEARLREALRSGSSYLLSHAYGKDEQARRASAAQVAGVNVMYDLYHRSKAAKMRQAAQYYAPPPSQPLKAKEGKGQGFYGSKHESNPELVPSTETQMQQSSSLPVNVPPADTQIHTF